MFYFGGAVEHSKIKHHGLSYEGKVAPDRKVELGMDKGLVHFSEDLVSVETTQEVASMFGLDSLNDVHTL
jgi:hypothetical protein